MTVGSALATYDIVYRLALALILGGLIGMERQWHQKMAGLRTNTLVAVGASGFTLLGVLATPVGAVMDQHVAAQIVTGIGFLGAGVILREGINVHGLNTAATLWCSAMVGALSGAGFVVAAGAGTFFVVLTNFALRPMIRRLNARLISIQGMETHYTFTVACSVDMAEKLRERMLVDIPAAGFDLRQIETELAGEVKATIIARALHPARADARAEQLTATILRRAGVDTASWSVVPVVVES